VTRRVEVARELAKLASTETRWHSIIKNMLFAWDPRHAGCAKSQLNCELGARDKGGRPPPTTTRPTTTCPHLPHAQESPRC